MSGSFLAMAKTISAAERGMSDDSRDPSTEVTLARWRNYRGAGSSVPSSCCREVVVSEIGQEPARGYFGRSCGVASAWLMQCCSKKSDPGVIARHESGCFAFYHGGLGQEWTVSWVNPLVRGGELGCRRDC